MIDTEHHKSSRLSWLRAAVLGADDGLLSTASLIVGVATANASSHNIMLAGIAGLFAGACSMAAGEYVSVSSQADSERADLARETEELRDDAETERKELAAIYVTRGLEADLAEKVAQQLTDHDALAAHARDELGILTMNMAKPLTAAIASAIAFAIGAVLPLLVVFSVPSSHLTYWIVGTTLGFLALLGSAGAFMGGARPFPAAVRVTVWGAFAMLVTASIGHFSGTSLGQ